MDADSDEPRKPKSQPEPADRTVLGLEGDGVDAPPPGDPLSQDPPPAAPAPTAMGAERDDPPRVDYTVLATDGDAPATDADDAPPAAPAPTATGTERDDPPRVDYTVLATEGDARASDSDDAPPAAPAPTAMGAERDDPPRVDYTVLATDGDAPAADADDVRRPPPDAPLPGDLPAHHPPPPEPEPKPAPRLVEPGTLINNNYRITRLVSAGGMGEVYRAENVFTGDPVAVKVILPGLAGDPSVLDLFMREARVLVQLRDDAIVRYHNFVLDPGLDRYCLIMEFVDGRHLGDRLKQVGPLDDQATLALMRRLGSGLRRAHARGVTHRDLSPDNVILREDRIEEAVLIDFGIARSTELGDGLAGRFAGKFKYIAPEQLGHWGGEIGPYTDVYGLALLIAAVARGKPLDMGNSVVAAAAARQAIPDLSGISHRLFPILQHMLTPDPAQRPGDMAAVLRMVDDPSLIPSRYRLPLWSNPITDTQAEVTGGFGSANGLRDATGSASPFGGAQAPAHESDDQPPQSRSRLPLMLGAAALLAVLGAGGWWFMRADPTVVPETAVAAPALDLPPRDSSTREGFLAEQPLPACALAERIGAGANSGQVLVLGKTDLDPAPVVAAYQSRFGVSPAVQRAQVADAQCATVDFLREIGGRPASPVTLDAQATHTADQLQIRGTVGAAPDRNLWLLLVPPTGELYDLSAQLAEGTGSRSFGFALGRPAQATPGDWLLVAIATDAPIASIAAAPAGADANELLPRVLAELRASGEAPSVSIQPISGGFPP